MPMSRHILHSRNKHKKRIFRQNKVISYFNWVKISRNSLNKLIFILKHFSYRMVEVHIRCKHIMERAECFYWWVYNENVESYGAHAAFTGIVRVLKRDSVENDLVPIFTARTVATARTKRRLHSIRTRLRTFLYISTRHTTILEKKDL